MNNGMEMTENCAFSNDIQILLKYGGIIIKCYMRVQKFQKVQFDPLTIKHKRLNDAFPIAFPV